MQPRDESSELNAEQPQQCFGLALSPKQWRWLKVAAFALLGLVVMLVFGNRVLLRNLVSNPGFESGTDGWDISYGTVAVAVTTKAAHSGKQAGLSASRSAHYVGPEQSLLKVMRPGKTYVCSGWVRVTSGEEEPVKMTIRQRDGNGRRYHLISTTAASSDTWRFLSGRFTLQPTGSLEDLTLYFEGPKRGVDLLVDDVRVVPDRFLLLVWPGGSALAILGVGALGGLAVRRPRWSAGCALPGALLALSLLASWWFDHKSAVVVGPAPDYVKLFQSRGFAKVVRGTLLEIQEGIQEPTLYEGTGVRIYGNCATNLAIVAKTAEIYGRVQGKVYFRGQKITVMPSADLWDGIDASGDVVRRGTVRTPAAKSVASFASKQTTLTNTAVPATLPNPGKAAGPATLFIGEIYTDSAAQCYDGSSSNEVGRLTFVETLTGPGMEGVGGVAISTNGQNLYAPAWGANALHVFRRNPQSGQLSSIQVLREHLSGAINVRLSPDQRYAVAVAYRSQAVNLYKRDLDTGKLEPLYVLKRREGVHGLGYAMRVRFSPDARQIYVADGASGGITTLACDPVAGLQWLETLANECTAKGSRGMEVLPDGRTIVMANPSSQMLAVFARDPSTGRLSLRQSIRNGQDGADHIKGQFGVTASPDGQFVYVCSGHLGGDNSLSVFRVTNQGKLEPVQAFVDSQDGLAFAGGRDACITPDGRNLYAVASKSGTLACFARDPSTGKLRLIQSFVDDQAGKELRGAAGPECSPDGRFVYVPLEKNRGISIYRRELTPSAKGTALTSAAAGY